MKKKIVITQKDLDKRISVYNLPLEAQEKIWNCVNSESWELIFYNITNGAIRFFDGDALSQSQRFSLVRLGYQQVSLN